MNWAWVAWRQNHGSTAPLRSLPVNIPFWLWSKEHYCFSCCLYSPVIPFIYPLSCKQINMPIPWDTWLSLYLRLAILLCALDIDFHCLSYHATKGHLIAVSFSPGEKRRTTFSSPDWWQPLAPPSTILTYSKHDLHVKFSATQVNQIWSYAYLNNFRDKIFMWNEFAEMLTLVTHLKRKLQRLRRFVETSRNKWKFSRDLTVFVSLVKCSTMQVL